MKTFILILIFPLMLPNHASACTCGGKPSIQDNWKHASQVFIGEVIDMDTSGKFYSDRGQQVIMFTVWIKESFKLQNYQGYDKRTFINFQEGTCDTYFDIGKKYLIYASGYSIYGFLHSSICSRTKLLDDTNEDEIEQLRNLYAAFNVNNEAFNLPPDNENFNYEQNLSKATHDKLARDKRNLVILSISLGVVLILTLVYVIRRKKTHS
jgi:hypothetical protein